MDVFVEALAFTSILFVTPEDLAILGAGRLLEGLVGGLCGGRHMCRKRSDDIVDSLFQFNATGLTGQDMKILNGMVAGPLERDKALFRRGDSITVEGTMMGLEVVNSVIALVPFPRFAVRLLSGADTELYRNEAVGGIGKGGLSVPLPMHDNAAVEGTWIMVDSRQANYSSSAAFGELHKALRPVGAKALALNLIQTIEMLAEQEKAKRQA